MNSIVSKYWQRFTTLLFPECESMFNLTTESHIKIMLILDTVNTFDFFSERSSCYSRGRPAIDRESFARAFVAKAVLNLSSTVALIDRLKADITLRRICGFTNKSRLPCAASFSNAFKEFANSGLPDKLHKALILEAHEDVLVHNISRDSTAIEVREKVVKNEADSSNHPCIKGEGTPKRGRGRPKRGEVIEEKPPTLLEQQRTLSTAEKIALLNQECSYGVKKNARGHVHAWVGYKLHIDTADGDIPVSCILTGASVHDSSVALPLEDITNSRVTSLYSLMDAAYDSQVIKDYISLQNKVPVIDNNPRRGEKIEFDPPKARRYKARSGAERVNSYLKDHFGGRSVMVKGARKVMCHLMFGILCISALQIVRANC